MPFPTIAANLRKRPRPQLHGFKGSERRLHFSDRSQKKRHDENRPRMMNPCCHIFLPPRCRAYKAQPAGFAIPQRNAGPTGLSGWMLFKSDRPERIQSYHEQSRLNSKDRHRGCAMSAPLRGFLPGNFPHLPRRCLLSRPSRAKVFMYDIDQ